MKFVKFKDIENNDFVVASHRVDMVRKYTTKSNDPQGNAIIEITVLIKVGDVTVPVQGTFEETLEKLGIKV